MAVVVTCPACQRKARVPDAAVGKSVKCPGCGNTFPAVSADAPPPFNDPTDLADEPAPPASPEADGRRVTRTGVALLGASQALLAAGTALKLLLALIQLVTSDTGPRGSFHESLTEFVAVVSTLALLGGIVTALIGAVFCTVTPGAIPVRAAAGSVLVLSVLYAIQAPTGSLRDMFAQTAGVGRGSPRGPDLPTSGFAGLLLLVTLTPEAFEAARQAMLAAYARSQARRLGDRAAAGLSRLLTIAHPAAVVGLIVLGIVVGMFSSKPHPTFDRVLAVLVLLAKTVLVALGAFVLLRVWVRLGTVRA
jgi:hypothetical protein